MSMLRDQPQPVGGAWSASRALQPEPYGEPSCRPPRPGGPPPLRGPPPRGRSRHRSGRRPRRRRRRPARRRRKPVTRRTRRRTAAGPVRVSRRRGQRDRHRYETSPGCVRGHGSGARGRTRLDQPGTDPSGTARTAGPALTGCSAARAATGSVAASAATWSTAAGGRTPGGRGRVGLRAGHPAAAADPHPR